MSATRFRNLMLSAITVLLMMFVSLSAVVVAEVEYIELPPAQLEMLSSDYYEERESAYKALQKWSEQHLNSSPELLHAAWKTNDDPEVQARCYGLMLEALRLRRLGKGKGFLGIQMSGVMLPARPKGQAGRQAVSVNMVLPDTPAQKVGLRGGDMILRVDDLDLSSADEGPRSLMLAVDKFSAYIKSKQPEQRVSLHFLRGDKVLIKEVILMRLDPANDRNLELTEAEFEAYFNAWLKKMKLGNKPD
ncbi:MAG: PDZ domain-containing protein [Akkermansiaceae bacterium]|nr:PDZ domain-containing protein [Akkermansiaceae bacterium]